MPRQKQPAASSTAAMRLSSSSHVTLPCFYIEAHRTHWFIHNLGLRLIRRFFTLLLLSPSLSLSIPPALMCLDIYVYRAHFDVDVLWLCQNRQTARIGEQILAPGEKVARLVKGAPLPGRTENKNRLSLFIQSALPDHERSFWHVNLSFHYAGPRTSIVPLLGLRRGIEENQNLSSRDWIWRGPIPRSTALNK